MKIGFSDIIAAIALVLGAVSLWFSINSGMPKISVRDMGPVKILDESRPEMIIAAFPIIITNHGGQPTTLIQITRSNNPTVFKVNIGAKFETDQSLELQYIILNKVFNSLKELGKAILANKFSPLSFPQVLNLPLAEGVSKDITIVVLIKAKNGASVRDETVGFDSNLLFADGTTYRMAVLNEPTE